MASINHLVKQIIELSQFTGPAKKRRRTKSSKSSSTSSGSSISTVAIQRIVEKLKSQRCRDSTRETYHRIWRIFSDFYLRLDDKPISWEERITLFTGYLIDTEHKSSTIKTYISALKGVLAEEGYKLETNDFTLSALTHACRIRNDTIIHRLPIHKSLLKLIINEVQKWADEIGQPYLAQLYKALFSATYYGLLRVGEVTCSPHVILARDVLIGVNKKKLMFILRSSKTHSKGDPPQIIKIDSTPIRDNESRNPHCPFTLLNNYIQRRPLARSETEQFFVFSDGSPIKPSHMRNTLKLLIKRIGLDERNYSVHGLRGG